MPAMWYAGLVHTHSKSMSTPQTPRHHHTQRNLSTHPHSRTNHIQRRVTIHSAHGIRLVLADAGIQRQTTEEDLDVFTNLLSQDHDYHSQYLPPPTITDRIYHNPSTSPPPRINCMVDVSIDTNTLPQKEAAAIRDKEGAAAPGTFRLGYYRKKT